MTYIKSSKYSWLLCFIATTLMVACTKKIEINDVETTVKSDSIVKSPNQLLTYQTPKNISEIKEFYAAWEQKLQTGFYKKIAFNYNCDNEKSGKLTYFFEDGNLRIIEHSYSEYDHFSATDRYYIVSGNPFFIFSKEAAWSFEAEGKTKDNITEYRGYIINNEPAECLQKKYTVYSHSQTNPKPDEIENTVSDCKNILKLITKYQKLATYKSTTDVECN